ncbi:MAG: hypothetical protein WBZ31_01300 [Thiobacillus sp.]|jgi:hypothetical protein
MQTATIAPRKGGLKWAMWLVLLPLLIFALYLAFVMNWSYSEGERAGYLQRFSHKGWLCKTYEGELAMTTVPGVAPVLWNFTVHDAAVAAQLNALAGKRVVVFYEEHRGIPTTCYGETGHFVSRVREIDDIGTQTNPVRPLLQHPQ